MNLEKKRELAAKVLKVGKNRLVFRREALSEIKEAITRQDIKDLYKEGIIYIKPVKGRRKIKKRKTKRGPGKRKKTLKKRKENYVKLVRKLRRYIKSLKEKGEISRELYWDLRKKIRAKLFRSKTHLKEYLETFKKTGISMIKTTKKRKIRKTKKKKK